MTSAHSLPQQPVLHHDRLPADVTYLNLLLANLNACESIRGTLADTDYNTFENSKSGPSTFRSASGASILNMADMIHIQTSTGTRVRFDSDKYDCSV